MSVLPGSIHAEDLQPGLVLELGSHPVTEAEIIDFASQWDPHYFHVDPERAKEESRYAGLIASGLHTLSIYQRLWVLGRNDEWNVIAGAGIDNVRLLRPVRPGDVLTARSEVRDVRLEAEKQRGYVVFSGRVVNQHDKPVLELEIGAYVAMRSA